MFFSLAVAIGATILWINQWLADFINAKINPYTVSPEDKEKDNFKAKLKLWLIVIMALFWAAIIRFYGLWTNFDTLMFLLWEIIPRN